MPPHSPELLKAALTLGPVAAQVNADSYLFRNYDRGIIDWLSCGTAHGHAILIVGFGVEDVTTEWMSPFDFDTQQVEYFIIKNSWGKKWGESGFAKILNTQLYDEKGICGLFREGFFAVAKHDDDYIDF